MYLIDNTFYGLSSETKPTTGGNGNALGTGYFFEEVDTGNRYYWSGAGWNAAQPFAVEEVNQPGYENNTLNVASVAFKPVVSATYSPLWFSAAADATCLVKASPGHLFGFRVTNVNTALRYVQLFNLTAVPADTTVPDKVIPLPAGSATVPAALGMAAEFGNNGVYFSTGIVICVSTTKTTLTAATDADHTVNAVYF